MNEQLHRYFLKEEEFLDQYDDLAHEAARLLNDEWSPNTDCDDKVRRNQQYFLSTGELGHFVFDGAAVYHDANGFSSVQIVLKSSKRVVTVRVREADGNLVAEKIVDKSVG